MGDDPQRAKPAKQFAQRSLCHGTAVHVVCTAVGAKRREAAREGRQPAVASEVATAGSLSKARLGDRSRRAERRGAGWAANSLAGPGGLGSLTHNTNSYAQTSMSTIPKSIATHPPLTRDDVLDGRDVAELLHLPISTVLEYARRGLLPGRKLGRRWIFLRDEVEAAVRGRSVDRSAA